MAEQKNILLMQELISHNAYGTYFGVSQNTLDNVWNRLTASDGNSVIYISMEIGADPDVFHPVKDFLLEKELTSSPDARTQIFIDKYLYGPRKIPNYSGGLGVLAGDTLKSYADMHIPVAGVSLLYREGYFSQHVDSQLGQIDQAATWKPENTPTLFQLHEPGEPDMPLAVSVPFFNGDEKTTPIKAQVWMKLEAGQDLDYFVPEFLLDYNLPTSPEWVKEASQQLYSAKSILIKANQRRLLGYGILPLMEKLGLTARTFHLNEQHGVAVTLHLIIKELEKLLGQDYGQKVSDKDILDVAEEVAKHLVYTIHTPVKAGHDRFDRTLYSKITEKTCRQILNLLAQDEESPDEYNFTSFAMRVNRAVNSVSRLHRDVTRRQFPKFSSKIRAITNGVHLATWASENRTRVFNSTEETACWKENPGCFAGSDLAGNKVFRQQLHDAWQQDNERLIKYVNKMLIMHRAQMSETWIEPPNYISNIETDSFLEPKIFTIGFARRFSTYKRADLIFDDISALADILIKGNWKVNFIFAGKAHPQDEPGKSVIKLILDIQEKLYRQSNGLAKLIFIPGYDMEIAKIMVSGSHAWLNSPKRPLEASGTSGMKAAMNGVPNISVMDGWWVEGYHNGQTGWKFGYEGSIDEADMSEDRHTLLYEEDAISFYNLLPEVLQIFYEQPDRYMDIAINNLQFNVPIFNTHRMAAEYVRKYDLRLEEKTAKLMRSFRKLYQSESENE
ncbi:MAG: alpha-glucan family phosphorylase [Desulfobulbaceae bacterium]|nr:alpha-glucan family phosphorylase [Desulfobulbaceae bacterium]